MTPTTRFSELAARYVDAWERCDVEAFTAMLVDDAVFAMPPIATWYRTREGIATWAALSPMSGAWRWRTVLTRANGQPALGFYARAHETRAYFPFAVNVLTLRGSASATSPPSSPALPRRPTPMPMSVIPSRIRFSAAGRHVSALRVARPADLTGDPR
jgi:hypothetical protein